MKGALHSSTLRPLYTLESNYISYSTPHEKGKKKAVYSVRNPVKSRFTT